MPIVLDGVRERAAVDNDHDVLELGDDVLVPLVADLDVDHLRAGSAIDTEKHRMDNSTGVVYVIAITLVCRVSDDRKVELRERLVQLRVLAQGVLEVVIADMDALPRHIIGPRISQMEVTGGNVREAAVAVDCNNPARKEIVVEFAGLKRAICCSRPSSGQYPVTTGNRRVTVIKGVNRAASQVSDARDVCWSGGEGDAGLVVVSENEVDHSTGVYDEGFLVEVKVTESIEAARSLPTSSDRDPHCRETRERPSDVPLLPPIATH
ncbi:hypothetical protein C8Q74DRAFT_1436571, partial [Fomes fomentarius]